MIQTIAGEKHMKILVYGAGVTGSFLCHALCDNGQDVELLARGNRKEILSEEGLVLHHYFGGAVTTDHPKLVDAVGNGHYDVIFVAMPYRQMLEVTESVAKADADTVIFVGNNMHAKYIEKTVQELSPAKKNVLFGLQENGGERRGKLMISVCDGNGSMTIGPVKPDRTAAAGNQDGTTEGAADYEKVRRMLEGMFVKTGYELNWVSDMDAWYKCHLAKILPQAYLTYALECNLYKASMKQIALSLDASYEAYRTLREMGYEILPEGSEHHYKKSPSRFFTVTTKLFVMTRTQLGEMEISSYYKQAVREMEDLSMDFSKLLGIREDEMKAWKKLKGQMPSWKKLHKT